MHSRGTSCLGKFACTSLFTQPRTLYVVQHTFHILMHSVQCICNALVIPHTHHPHISSHFWGCCDGRVLCPNSIRETCQSRSVPTDVPHILYSWELSNPCKIHVQVFYGIFFSQFATANLIVVLSDWLNVWSVYLTKKYEYWIHNTLYYMEYIFPTTHIHTRDYDIPHELLAEKIEISLNETSYPVLCWIDVVPSIRHFSSVQISCIRISSSAAVQNVTTSFFSGTKTFFCTKLLHNLYMLFIQQNDIVYFSMKTLCTSNLLASNKHHGYETVQPPFGCCKKCVCFFQRNTFQLNYSH